jgi:hypothetical protein
MGVVEMTYSDSKIRLRDIPDAGPKAWLYAACAISAFAASGMHLAASTGSLEPSSLPGGSIVWAVGMLLLGLVYLYWLNNELREVSA